MKGFTPVILILVSVGVFFFFIDPQKKEFDELVQEKNNNSITIERTRDLREARGALNEKYKNISTEDRQKLEKILPDTVDNVRLILDINNIANKYGLSLRGISVSGGPIDESGEINRSSGSTAGQLYGVISLSFSFTADYELFKIFIKDLEDSMRLVDIINFSVSASSANSASSTGEFYDYSLTLNTYWLR